ncbi:MAG: hypothetical protein LC667_20335 [Thioalkalivibrio sp.]|nr:hypothetical protein [Thioalkalivibrio sp.]
MFPFGKTRIKLFGGLAASSLALVIALSHEPAIAGAPYAAAEPSMTVFANIPVNEIELGQFCQAYANVYDGTPPFTYQWSGQFSGNTQIVNGFISSTDWLKLEVWDSSTPTAQYATHTANLTIGDDYNWECEV